MFTGAYFKVFLKKTLHIADNRRINSGREMTTRIACSFSVFLCFLAFTMSCMRAPKRVQNSSDASVAAADATGIDATNSGSSADVPTPAVTNPLAALHAEQKSCVSCHEPIRPAPAHYVISFWVILLCSFGCSLTMASWTDLFT